MNTQSVWWMLLSHHAPCDWNRTWKLFGIRICVRCLSMFLFFMLAVFAGVHFIQNPGRIPLLPCCLAMVPAGLDFLMEELLPRYPQSNFLRFATGALFGGGCGACFWKSAATGTVRPAAVFLIAALVMQWMVALVFFLFGHIEAYLAKYEQAVSPD